LPEDAIAPDGIRSRGQSHEPAGYDRPVSGRGYLEIVDQCESWLERHGDSHLGVGWPDKDDADRRYEVMTDLVRGEARDTTVSLLDFGCGTAQLWQYIQDQDITQIAYSGLDVSPQFLDVAGRKFPTRTFYCLDMLEDGGASLPTFDYIVMNGVFTMKCGLSFDEMLAYFERLLGLVWSKAGRGIAFNVMSKHVDWERDDLFHLPLDTIATIVIRELTRKFVIRNDYGLYENTIYVYR
jgi:SAM-dependent methyltransferase